MTAKEHCEKVRFDPNLVTQRFPRNAYRLIYPKEAKGDDPELYLKILRKSNEIWKAATGTFNKREETYSEEKKKIKNLVKRCKK